MVLLPHGGLFIFILINKMKLTNEYRLIIL